ncbi:MAG: RluA family pseudouridine synthase [Rickettsiaceae bacterium]|nr:MAG: RluA family pseudouridine synthase [Rickettsiaceae bacterium]
MNSIQFKFINKKIASEDEIIDASTVDCRLDKSICSLLPNISRSLVQKSIKNNHVSINRVIISDCAYKIKQGDVVEIQIIEPLATEHMCATEMALEIVFEDDDILVINKPSGLTVHPGAGNYQDTLANALLYYSKSLSDIGGHFRPGIIHRLDKDTSGLIIVAKNNEAHVNIAAQIEKRDLIRKYKALVWGMINPANGTIQYNLGRDKKLRQKMSVLNFGGKIAITQYTTKEIFLGGLISLIECKLQTGRTHQIRVHLNHIGHSVLGDQTYGNNNRKLMNIKADVKPYLLNLKRQALHSYYLGFVHPKNGSFLELEAKLPEDMQTIIDNLKL